MAHTFKELIYIDKNRNSHSNNKGIFPKIYPDMRKNYRKKRSFRQIHLIFLSDLLVFPRL